MRMLKRAARPLLAMGLLAVFMATGRVQAEPVLVTADDQVIERLPACGAALEERRLRQLWMRRPADAATAVPLARRYLARAREQGDPRPASQALAVLQAWSDPATAPDEVLLLQATLQQYLHGFERAASQLEQLVARRPSHAQAWLTLATVRRVQGRYRESDAACRGLEAAGVRLEGVACLAENDGLRGRFESARSALRSLLDTPRLSASSRGWLLTTLAELEQRAGRAQAADVAFRQALAAEADGYTRLAWADHLMQQGRLADAAALLANQPRTDAVVLRLAMAGARLKTPGAAADAAQVRAAFEQAGLRPEARLAHARERALFALWVESRPDQALTLARDNLRQQREPLDLLVFAQAARATGDTQALQELDRIRKEMDIHDQRLDGPL